MLDFFIEDEKTTLEGKYITLENDQIKLYVPDSFKKTSEAEYREIIEAIDNPEKKRNLLKRFNHYRISKGNVYYIIDDAVEMTIKTLPYFPFSKKESSYISGLFLKSCIDFSELYNSDCKRLRSGYSGNKKTQVFKGVYEVKTSEGTFFNTNYIISSNHKTFSVLIISPFDIDFDAYIEKTIVQ